MDKLILKHLNDLAQKFSVAKNKAISYDESNNGRMYENFKGQCIALKAAAKMLIDTTQVKFDLEQFDIEDLP
jgi:hypothetical protein